MSNTTTQGCGFWIVVGFVNVTDPVWTSWTGSSGWEVAVTAMSVLGCDGSLMSFTALCCFLQSINFTRLKYNRHSAVKAIEYRLASSELQEYLRHKTIT